jgi:hypothetical protein
MAFKKGDKRPLGAGMQKGQKTQKTEQWEAISEYMVGDGLQRFSEEIKSLKGDKYIYIYMQLLEYFKPKLARQEVTGKDGENQVHEVVVSFKK